MPCTALSMVVLMLAPCATDMCLEVHSEPVWLFETAAECRAAAEAHNTSGNESWAWCSAD